MRRLAALMILTSVPLLAQPYHRRLQVTVRSELQAAYERAIYDSSVYRAANLRRLRPLVPDKNGEVLVATLTSLDDAAGTLITAQGDGIWVTGVPEVQETCRQFTGDVVMKVRQLLGLPPDADVPRVLVLRVAISDIFRPSPDANVTTTMPCARLSGAPLPADCGNAYPPTTTPAHYAWMATDSFILHQLPGGYPWTHLGYTYNWAPGADRYGASEYVIRTGANALIVENTTPVQYCAAPSAR